MLALARDDDDNSRVGKVPCRQQWQRRRGAFLLCGALER